VNDFPRGEVQINSEDIIRALLKATNTFDPPIDARKLANYLRLKIVPFNSEDFDLPPEVRAFLWPAERTIGIHKNLTPTRRTFSILHEIGHFVLPGHLQPVISEDDKFIDSAEELSVDSLIQQEIEANKFAADCLFLLDRFDRTISGAVLDWLNIQVVANNYQASIEATARRWIEHTQEEKALVVFNPTSRKPDALPPLEIIYTVTSETFRQKYFSRLVPGFKMGPDTLAFRVFHGLEYRERPEDVFFVGMPNGENLEFQMSLFSNSYRMFGLLSPIAS
jgi:Zn-dependent peptidase ImmA (M78 family)